MKYHKCIKPAGIYLLKVNNGNSKTISKESLLKLNNKDARSTLLMYPLVNDYPLWLIPSWPGSRRIIIAVQLCAEGIPIKQMIGEKIIYDIQVGFY